MTLINCILNVGFKSSSVLPLDAVHSGSGSSEGFQCACTRSTSPNPNHPGSCNAEPWGCPCSSWFIVSSFSLLFFNSSQTHARHTTVPLNHLMHIRAHAACCLTHPTQEAAMLSPEDVLVVLDFIYLFSFFLLFLNISQPTLGMLQSHRTTSFHPAYTREAQKHHHTSLTWNILGISLASAL